MSCWNPAPAEPSAPEPVAEREETYAESLARMGRVLEWVKALLNKQEAAND